MKQSRNQAYTLAAGVLLAAAVGGTIGVVVRASGGKREALDDAPSRTARRSRLGDYAVVGRTVTINRPRADLYTFWRRFEMLPRFMENVLEVRPTAGGSDLWIIAAPAGRTVEIETEVVDDRENERIAWRSTPASQVECAGWVAFRDAPTGRGTYVEAVVQYVPPAGEVGRLVAKILQREPRIQVRRDLKRFKMLMETGEVATSSNQRTAA